MVKIKRCMDSSRKLYVERIEIGPKFLRLLIVLRRPEDGMPISPCCIQLFSPGRFCHTLAGDIDHG